jgi:hypothetical protein
MTSGTPRCRHADVHGLRPDEHHAGAGVLEDEGDLVGVEVEVGRHGGRAGQQAAEVGEHGLGAVLGEHGGPPVGSQVERAEAVGHPVELLADLTPAERDPVVAQRDLVRALVGQARRDRRHRQVSISPIGSPTL